MKKVLMIIVIYAAIPNSVYGQKLKKNEVDRYTKEQVKETSYEVLARKMFRGVGFRAIKNGESSYLEMAVTESSIFSVRERDNLYFLLDNDSTVVLSCTQGEVANYTTLSGITTWTATPLYYIGESDMKTLMNHYIKGLRIDMGDTYREYNKISKDNAQSLPNALYLLTKN